MSERPHHASPTLLYHLLSPGILSAGFMRWEYRISLDTLLDSIQHLRTLGCVINEPMPETYQLISTSLDVWADYLESPHTYEDELPPPKSFIFRQTASTQEIARQQNRWCAVLADEQTAGRGRLGRAWLAPPGTAVLMSLCWPCFKQQPSLDYIAFRVAVAVAKVAEKLLDSPQSTQVRIKWPNDILVDGKKLAGILIERSDGAAIIGIGFNVGLVADDLDKLPDELTGRITSLAMLGCKVDRLHVAAKLIEQCHKHLSSPHEKLLLDEWRSRSPLGYDAKFQCDGETIVGTVLDLDPTLGLIVRRNTGEIVHLPAATTSVVS